MTPLSNLESQSLVLSTSSRPPNKYFTNSAHSRLSHSNYYNNNNENIRHSSGNNGNANTTGTNHIVDNVSNNILISTSVSSSKTIAAQIATVDEKGLKPTTVTATTTTAMITKTSIERNVKVYQTTLRPTLSSPQFLIAQKQQILLPKIQRTDAPMLNYIFDTISSANKHHHHDHR